MSAQSGLSPQQITLLKMGLQYMGDQNSDISVHAKRVKSQIELMQSQGRTLDMTDWVQMAKILSSEAIKKDIGATKIAETIYPLVDGSAQKLYWLRFVQPSLATTKLLEFTGINVAPETQSFLTSVVSELQKMIFSPKSKPN